MNLSGVFNALPLSRLLTGWLVKGLGGIVLGWSCLSLAWAQYRFDHWTTDQGLPQNSIYAIQQTRDGYLWLATLDGLVRFDGVRFTVFNKSTTPDLTQNRFVALLEDREGVLWAGTDESDIWRWEKGRFTPFQIQGATPFKDRNVYFRSEPDGSVLLTTRAGILHWRNGKLQPELETRGEFQRYFGPTGIRWELDAQGILRRIQAGRVEQWKLPPPFHGPYVAPMCEDRQGQLWIGSDPTLWRLKDGTLTAFGPAQGLSAKTFTTIYEDHTGRLWIGTRSEGLVLYHEGRFTQFTTADGLSSNNIRSLYEDREGTLWVGTDNNGLMRVNRREITSLSKAQGLASANVYPLLQTRAGDIWIGAYPNLSRFTQGAIKNYTLRDGLPMINTESLYEDRDGTLWIGTIGSLVQYRNGRFIDLIDSFALPHHTYNLTVIYQDRAGAMWFGTSIGLVKQQHGQQDGQYQVFTKAEGLPSNDIKALVEDAQGGLWIGTYGGVSYLRDGRFTNYTTANGLTGNRVRSLHLDAEGVLWIGTYDSGLSRWKDGRLANITRRQGLANEGVFQILEDRRGNLWMSSNQGIHRVSKQQLNDCADGKLSAVSPVTYGKAEGMLNNECNGGRQPAGIQTQDGKLWFPTQDGVAIIDPEAVASNPLPPPVVIETALIDRQPFAQPATLQLEPGQSNLEIEYTANSFIRAEQVKFKYQLAGLDRDWIDAGTRRTAYFSHIPAGEYTFRVIAANSDGVWNNEGASLKVIVLAPFYRRWWFLSLVTLALVGIGTAGYQYRVRGLERARAAQEEFSRRLIESQEHERKRIAAELHDGLSQSLVIIKNRAALSLDMPDDAENALDQMEEIAEASTQALEEVRSVIHDLRPIQLDRLGFTKSVQAMLQQVSAANHLQIHSELDAIDGVFSKEAEINLYRIVQECLNNIVKHAQATEVRVLLKKQSGIVELTIADNGRGFANAEVGMRNAEANHNPLSSGFGLTSIVERARILGCRPQIQSVPGQGTTITLKIPTDKATTV